MNKYGSNENKLFFYGIYQGFLPGHEFFLIKKTQSRMVEKNKVALGSQYTSDILEFHCITKSDYEFLGNNIEEVKAILNKGSTSLISGNNNMNNTTGNSSMKEYILILKGMLKLLNKFKKLTKSKNNKFGVLAREILVYNKILVFYIFDDKTFRAEFFLKKYLYSPSFSQEIICTRAIFKYISYLFRQQEKKGDDNSMEYIILFNDLNLQYLSLARSLNYILKSYCKSKYELIKIIDNQSNIVGRCLENIAKINELSNESLKNREQPENDKFKGIEEIGFNSNKDKSFDCFDGPSLDVVVDKNNFFIILFEQNNFVVKKAPLSYYQITKKKTSKMKDKIFSDIFPYIMQKVQYKNIKNNLLSKSSFSLDTVLETSDNYIIGVKLFFMLLPSFNGKLYIICNGDLDRSGTSDGSNYGIMEENGISKEFGLFFSKYFGIRPSDKTINFKELFCISEYQAEKGKKQIFEVFLGKGLSSFKTYFIKETDYHKKEIEEIGAIIKKKFLHETPKTSVNFKPKVNNSLSEALTNDNINGNSNPSPFYKSTEIIRLEMCVKRSFKVKKEIYYLIQMNFLDYKYTNINCNIKDIQNGNDNFYQTQQIKLAQTRNPESIQNSRSGSSIRSYKSMKESVWNITNKKKEIRIGTKNMIDQISFVYNISLIIIAISISIIIKIYSSMFYGEFLRLITLREINNEFYHGIFHLSNMAVIEHEPDEDGNIRPNTEYNSLDTEYRNNIKGYDFDLYRLFGSDFSQMANGFFDLFISLNHNFTNGSTKNQLYPYITKPIYLLSNDGIEKVHTYGTIFDLPKNSFYILSKNDNFYFNVPFIEYDDINARLIHGNENQQFFFTIVKNFFTIIKELTDIIYQAKRGFKHSLNKYKFLDIIIFLGFLCFNIFSGALLYLSIQMSLKEIRGIVDKITMITMKHKLEGEHKLRGVKRIITNEIKCSSALDEIKRKNSNQINPSSPVNQPSSIIPSQNEQFQSEFFTNNSNNTNISNKDSNDSMALLQPNKSMNTKYYFNIYSQVLHTLFLLGSIYGLYTIITFPIIINYLNKIEIKRVQTENCDDLQGSGLIYYIDLKFGLGTNNMDIPNEIEVFSKGTDYIYSNFTSGNKLIFSENNKNYIQKLAIVNSKKVCQEIVNKNEFFEATNLICDYEPGIGTKIETTISSFITQLRGEFNNYNMTENKKVDDIISAYHSRSFQFNNILEGLFFINFLSSGKYDGLLPDFENYITKGSTFLVVIFLVMVATEIFNYFISAYFVLRKLSKAIHIFTVIEKFFINNAAQKNGNHINNK